jgi:uncharacterized protein YecT (DUF1311 family)
MLTLALVLAAAPPSLDSEITICQAPGEYRPLTLCLAEREFERADARLNTQWKITFPAVRAARGTHTAQTLRNQQRAWIVDRDRKCEAIASPTPTTQQGRNLMSCMAEITDRRTAELRRMTGSQ